MVDFMEYPGVFWCFGITVLGKPAIPNFFNNLNKSIGMKPLIGITTYFVADEELIGRRVRGTRGQDMLMSNLDYARSVHEGGGIPVALPTLGDLKAAEDLIERVDGLLLAGGEDLAPALFRQEAQPGLGVVIERRDRYEWALLEAALVKGIPVLGICRGFQLLNVYFGGTLHQDLAAYYNPEIAHNSSILGREALVHEVLLTEGTMLSSCYGVKTLWVNSLHHQGVDVLAAALVPAALSGEGLVEGFQHRTIGNVFGVQWHPEMLTERYAVHRNLFRYFVEKAEERYERNN
jgi:putative glutamine amidotransferase